MDLLRAVGFMMNRAFRSGVLLLLMFALSIAESSHPVEQPVAKRTNPVEAALLLLGGLASSGQTDASSRWGVFPDLTKATRHQNPHVRMLAGVALGTVSSQEAMPALSQALKSRNGDVRKMAVWVLGRIGPHAKEAVPDLIGVLEDRDKSIRLLAIQALGNIGPEARRAAPALMRLIVDKNKRVRKEADNALDKIIPKEAD